MRGLWSAVALLPVTLAALPARAGSAPTFTLPITSNDAIGLTVSRKAPGSSVMAGFGLWSDDGALELGGFRDGAARDLAPSIARAAELVSGKALQSRGIRASGSLYRAGTEVRGWSLGIEARRQWISDIGAALSGQQRTASDSRVSVSGKLRF